ncbi:PKD domain-containing protein [Photobacterium atrarenae]|uniref:Cadherin domain-containing protein n=1 Tax=Photobacterium atrarenae TaxID=865757 RepID=A0ABY5GJ20_9GAMM|nr:hypothetical protein [Photobacterium atrarenae]UTV29166.1 hypothetical protein NNL38_08070 [Photobacterium atrarenae]
MAQFSLTLKKGIRYLLLTVLLAGCSTDADDWDKKKQPEVNAGDDLVISTPITTVALQGKVKHHLDMYDTKSVQWRQSSGPSQVTLLDADELSARFIYPDQAGEYVFELTVTDTGDRKGSDKVTVIIQTVAKSVKNITMTKSATLLDAPRQTGIFEMTLQFRNPRVSVFIPSATANSWLTVSYDLNHNAVFDEGDIRVRAWQPAAGKTQSMDGQSEPVVVVESLQHGELYRLQEQGESGQLAAVEDEGFAIEVAQLASVRRPEQTGDTKEAETVLVIQLNKNFRYLAHDATQVEAILAQMNSISAMTPVQVVMKAGSETSSKDYIPAPGVYSQHDLGLVPDAEDDYIGLDPGVDLTSFSYRHR